jgi:hypothetical protein
LKIIKEDLEKGRKRGWKAIIEKVIYIVIRREESI